MHASLHELPPAPPLAPPSSPFPFPFRLPFQDPFGIIWGFGGVPRVSKAQMESVSGKPFAPGRRTATQSLTAAAETAAVAVAATRGISGKGAHGRKPVVATAAGGRARPGLAGGGTPHVAAAMRQVQAVGTLAAARPPATTQVVPAAAPTSAATAAAAAAAAAASRAAAVQRELLRAKVPPRQHLTGTGRMLTTRSPTSAPFAAHWAPPPPGRRDQTLRARDCAAACAVERRAEKLRLARSRPAGRRATTTSFLGSDAAAQAARFASAEQALSSDAVMTSAPVRLSVPGGLNQQPLRAEGAAAPGAAVPSPPVVKAPGVEKGPGGGFQWAHRGHPSDIGATMAAALSSLARFACALIVSEAANALLLHCASSGGLAP